MLESPKELIVKENIPDKKSWITRFIERMKKVFNKIKDDIYKEKQDGQVNENTGKQDKQLKESSKNFLCFYGWVEKEYHQENEHEKLTILYKKFSSFPENYYKGLPLLKLVIFVNNYNKMGVKWKDFDNLRVLIFEEGVKTISGFGDLKNLRAVDTGEGVEYICSQAFCNCTELQELVLGINVRVIDMGAFEHCHKLKELNCKMVKEIGSDAFLDCPLTELKMPWDTRFAKNSFNAKTMDFFGLEAMYCPSTGWYEGPISKSEDYIKNCFNIGTPNTTSERIGLYPDDKNHPNTGEEITL